MGPPQRAFFFLRLFSCRILRKIFEPKMNEVTGQLRRLHNEDLYALYSSSNTIQVIKSRAMTLAGHVVCVGERRDAYRVLVGKSERKRSLVRIKRR